MNKKHLSVLAAGHQLLLSLTADVPHRDLVLVALEGEGGRGETV